MNLPKVLLIVLILSLSNSFLKAQDCFDFYKNECVAPTTKFTYSENKSSISFLFKSGEKRNIPLRLYNGKDYRITICSGEVFGDVILFRLVRVEDGKVLYDNSKDDFNFHIEFSSVKTNDIYIEITAPEPSEGTADTIYYEGCIGVLVEDMISIKTGF